MVGPGQQRDDEHRHQQDAQDRQHVGHVDREHARSIPAGRPRLLQVDGARPSAASCVAPIEAATTSAIATRSAAPRCWPSTTRPGDRRDRRLEAHEDAEDVGGHAPQRLGLQRVGDHRRQHARPQSPSARISGASRSVPPSRDAGDERDERGHERSQREPLAAVEAPAGALGEQDVGRPAGGGDEDEHQAGRVDAAGAEGVGQQDDARRPRSATQTRSSRRRESATATETGPTNSIVTATPSGMRSSAS